MSEGKKIEQGTSSVRLNPCYDQHERHPHCILIPNHFGREISA
jgi:hypothetical protein